MTYNDYLIKVTEILKIRSSNYRLSQNDIIYMVNSVYEEIMKEINFSPIEQLVTMDDQVTEYDLNALYVPAGNEIALNVYRIVDKFGMSVGKYFTHLGRNIYQVKEEMQVFFYREYNTAPITFHRQVVPDIEALDAREQMLLFNVIIEGILFYTQENVPNPTSSDTPNSGNKTNISLYASAINGLRDQFPQI